MPCKLREAVLPTLRISASLDSTLLDMGFEVQRSQGGRCLCRQYSNCITPFQIQPTLSLCVRSATTPLWDHRSTGQL